MKYKISIVTSTRADYGILSPLIKRLIHNEKVNMELVVTGTHLKKEFGNTINEIKRDSVPIHSEIDILESQVQDKIMATTIIKFGEYFKSSKPDLVILLGDRFEILSVAVAAFNNNIPIAHLHGGELTFGAKDDAYRHCITKLATIHFPSTEEHRKRIIQLGENPDYVFNVGAMGVENIKNTKLLSLEDLEKSLGLNLDKDYFICTYHPETVNTTSVEEYAKKVLDFSVSKDNIDFIFTKSNIDDGGDIINKLLEEYSKKYNNIHIYASLGLIRYLSAVKYSKCVFGNSSSGIIEAPSLNVPTINIGRRQEGRLAANSVINCDYKNESLEMAFNKAMSFKEKVINPYGNGDTSLKIEKIILDMLENKKLNLKKIFFDL